jgi:hypothetical protein
MSRVAVSEYGWEIFSWSPLESGAPGGQRPVPLIRAFNSDQVMA